jgi:hypothetical protein
MNHRALGWRRGARFSFHVNCPPRILRIDRAQEGHSLLF